MDGLTRPRRAGIAAYRQFKYYKRAMFHEPILVEQFLTFFKEKTLHVFVDGTVGAGGHAKALLEAHPEIERFYGLDQDETALQIASETLHSFSEKVSLLQGNFRNMRQLVGEQNIDGLFLDLGVSSMQLDRPEKGFSFSKDGPLDMRMDPSLKRDAAYVVNTFSEKDLGRIFKELGEERHWRAAARAICEARKKKRLKTTFQLTEALKHVLTWSGRGGKKIHPMTLVFQALRIFVNDELNAVKEAVPQGIDWLLTGGRMGVIAFHSLEDRIVKHGFKDEAQKGTILLLTKKPLVADEIEVKRNPRSRSAKMRFVEKK
jgi:16S rRNA (cytosine1402-N4)-methyltransferase